MEYYVDQSLSQRRFNTLLLEVFAGLALVLGMLGIYGVLSNLVESGIREIGIRMAVGASPAAIGKLVLRQSLVPIAAGLAVGLTGSLVLGRFFGDASVPGALARPVDHRAGIVYGSDDLSGRSLFASPSGYASGLHRRPEGGVRFALYLEVASFSFRGHPASEE